MVFVVAIGGGGDGLGGRGREIREVFEEGGSGWWWCSGGAL